MPELPEVETMCRGIQAVTGSVIRQVQRPKSKMVPMGIFPQVATLRKRVLDKKIIKVWRLGKKVVLDLDSSDRIVFEPRMTGLALLVDPPDLEHLRLVIELSGVKPPRLLFWSQRGLSLVRLLSPRNFDQYYGPTRLGPDALTVSPELLRERFCKSSRAIKVALLDQRSLAGIGNLYASEILHRARVHPAKPCNTLRPAQWKRIHASMGEVLEEAILHQGSTLSDGMYRNAKNEAGSFQDSHRVYQRAAEKCVQCGKAKIVSMVQAQRSTFFCPRCQRP
jgi:formamidopyrimidine-DNA glycosylase